jgi:hypothetical protein
MPSVSLPNPFEDEIFLRLQHAELTESLTQYHLIAPS